MIRVEAIWLALGVSDLRGGIDVLLAQVLRGFAAVGAGPNVLSFGRFQNADEIAAALA